LRRGDATTASTRVVDHHGCRHAGAGARRRCVGSVVTGSNTHRESTGDDSWRTFDFGAPTGEWDDVDGNRSFDDDIAGSRCHTTPFERTFCPTFEHDVGTAPNVAHVDRAAVQRGGHYDQPTGGHTHNRPGYGDDVNDTGDADNDCLCATNDRSDHHVDRMHDDSIWKNEVHPR
jgi:hypothetical protein